jgi:hypothetical protein
MTESKRSCMCGERLSHALPSIAAIKDSSSGHPGYRHPLHLVEGVEHLVRREGVGGEDEGQRDVKRPPPLSIHRHSVIQYRHRCHLVECVEHLVRGEGGWREDESQRDVNHPPPLSLHRHFWSVSILTLCHLVEGVEHLVRRKGGGGEGEGQRDVKRPGGDGSEHALPKRRAQVEVLACVVRLPGHTHSETRGVRVLRGGVDAWHHGSVWKPSQGGHKGSDAVLAAGLGPPHLALQLTKPTRAWSTGAIGMARPLERTSCDRANIQLTSWGAVKGIVRRVSVSLLSHIMYTHGSSPARLEYAPRATGPISS